MSKDDGEPVTLASGTAPVSGPGVLATFDPTLLLNGLYELELTATDVQGQQVSESVAVTVEGQLKIGHFTLSFVDLAIPVSGLDIEIGRRYDSRDQQQRDFGVGWSLEVRQGSYVNNRPPGDGWQFQTGLVPCEIIQESKSHLTVVRLSDQEVYRFALRLFDGASTGGGCFADARFDFVDGPLPGSTLEVLGGTQVFWENGGDRVIDADSFELYEPEDVRLTTRDGRIFELNLTAGVTSLEDLNGNQLTITPAGITHSSGKGIAFERDAEGRIVELTDPSGNQLRYRYDAMGDLSTVTDAEENTTNFVYDGVHRLLEIHDPLGRRPVRNEYDPAGRLVSSTDAFGNTLAIAHDLENRQEVVTDRLGNVRVLDYDARGNVTRVTDAHGHVTSRTYDGRDNLLTETDPLGNTTTRTYDANGDVTSITDPLGSSRTFTYDGRGQVLSVTDARGGMTTNIYDAAGNLLSTTDALGQVTSWTYDPRGLRSAETDPQGNVTQYAYDAFGNLTARIDRLGVETSFTYAPSGNLLTRTVTRTTPAGPESLTSRFTYDALGRQVATTDPLGNSTATFFDAVGSIVKSVDVLGGETIFTYGPAGRLTRTTFADGTAEAQTYDAEGRVVTRSDRAGRVTRTSYDAAGRVVEVTFPDGSTARHAYDAAGRLVALTDARGHVTSFAYDAAGRKTRVTNAAGEEMRFTYDANGNRTSMTGARGHTTIYEYDALNRRVRTEFPDGTDHTVVIDPLGRRISETDQAGQTTVFAYDAEGRLLSVADALGQTTSFGYDELGNRVSQTDAAGRATIFEYDGLGRRTKRTLPAVGTPPRTVSETLTYDAAGNRTSRTRFDGSTVRYAYDELGRLESSSFPDGSAISLTYTATGQRASVTDTRGTTTYVYDFRDRLIRMAYPDARSLSYTYDAHGNRESLTAQIGLASFTTTYTHDAVNRLSTVTDPDGRVYTYTYDANGNRAALAYPNSAITTYAHDALNRLTSLTTETGVGDVIQSYAYTLGPAGSRTRIDEAGGGVHEYAYDPLYRLTNERVSDATGLVYENVFEYDAVGNRLTQDRTDSSGTMVSLGYAYDQQDRISSAGGAGFAWDDNGGLVSRSGASEAVYTWDAEGRLTRIELAGGTVVEHAYDVDGNRVRTRVTPPDEPAEVTNFLVDASGPLAQVIAESDAGGTVAAYYVRGDDLLAVLRPGSTRFFHADGLGSVRRLTDEAGLVTDSYTFSAFGELVEHTGTDPNAFLFAGEQLDANSRFYYLRARWMDPETGRFASPDPFPGIAAEPRSLHQYLYAENNPVNRVDPSGYLSTVQVTAAVAAIALVATAALGSYWFYIAGSDFPVNLSNLQDNPPDAALLGVQWSVSAGRLVRRVRHPVAVGLSLGLAFLGFVGSLEVLFPFDRPGQAWVYAAFGVYAGLTVDRGPFRGIPNPYAGLAWNVPDPEDYATPAFCASFKLAAETKRLGVPVNICTSKAEPAGKPPSASITLNRFSKYGAVVSSRMSYVFLDSVHLDRLVSPPRSLDQLEPWVGSLIEDVP